MNIIIRNRDECEEDKVYSTIEQLDQLERELVIQIKDSLSNLITMDTLYEIRDHIDNLIVNWEDKEIEID